MTRPLRPGSGQAYAEVIGDPIAHSKSPLIHNFWLAKLGIDAEYRACHVRAEELEDYFAQRRGDAEWRGCNVTIPHKEKVLALSDWADGDPDPVFVGSANVISATSQGMTAYNTDVGGFLEPFSQSDIAGKRAVLVGAGGAALAVAYALRSQGLAYLTVMNRNVDRAADLLDEAMIAGDVRSLAADAPACDILVNATSLGMDGQPPLALSLDELPPSAIVYDLVYVPLETDLLRQARKLGLRTIDGLHMLVGQAAAAFELFFGHPAPREHDAELRALLTA